MKKFTYIFVLSVILFFSANPNINANNFSSKPTIDGVLTKIDLGQTIEKPLAGGGKVFYKIVDSYLYVAFRGIKQGISHVCVTDGKDIYVLHASGALGRAVFQNQSGKWTLTEKFKWEMRYKKDSTDLEYNQKEYFEKYGWVANVGEMGNNTEMEYLISNKFLDGNKFRFNAVYAVNPDSIQYFPQNIKDDSKIVKLISGDPPNVLNFDTKTWATIKNVGFKDNSLLQSVNTQNAKFAELTAKKDFKSAAEIYTENGQLLQPNGDIISGRKGIAEYWKATFGSGVNEIKVITTEVEGKGDMLYEIGKYEAYISGGQLVDEGKFIVIWKKVNGEWLRHRDIWNSNRKAQ